MLNHTFAAFTMMPGKCFARRMLSPSPSFKSKSFPLKRLLSFSRTSKSGNDAASPSSAHGMTERTRLISSSLMNPLAGRSARRLALSRAVTLVEASDDLRKAQASLLLKQVSDTALEAESSGGPSNHCGLRGAFRIGIAGPPGAGKSTFIERFGLHLLGMDSEGNVTRIERSPSQSQSKSSLPIWYPLNLGVLSIDPSSSYSGGSILGDKTRMPELSRHPDCFVRPSPSSQNLGGISAYTHDVIQLCQASGCDLVLVETVGIGQSEVEIDKAGECLFL